MSPATDPQTPLLDRVNTPEELRCLAPHQLPELAEEIREFLVSAVSRTGGHLGPNLGVVELTIALHRIFDSPRDPLLWDTGHQAYVHKLFTGRKDMSRLRARGGLSGYPSRAESAHDFIENSHASTSLSYADGLAKAFWLRHEEDRHVVAVIGDGALTGGMAWEALNNIADVKDRRIVIVVNDNGRSYAPTRGALAAYLTSLRTARNYERILGLGKQLLRQTPVVGTPVYDALHGAKKGFKDLVAPQGLFEDLGLKYIGPVDGHSIPALEHALRRAKGFGGPVIVHCVTRKGKGHPPAEEDEADRQHAIGAVSAVPQDGPPRQKWTSVFADEMVKVGTDRPDVVAVTAAMLLPVGLGPFTESFPDRVFDVGIAEAHAATSSAGLATGGLHPVVAVYSTFLNRAFDQVLLDVALHKCGVTFVLDRAGVTGSDGASHNGMWDMSLLQVVPGLRLAAPRDAARLRAQLREALDVDDAPTVIRFPKGELGADIEAVDSVQGIDVLHRSPPAGPGVLIVSIGAMAPVCLEAAALLEKQGISATVVDPQWVTPLSDRLPALAAEHRLVATVEDNGIVGGIGAAVALTLGDADVGTPVRRFALPQRFWEQAERREVLAEAGLTGAHIAEAVAADLREGS